jgi:hypothetical protein
MRSDGVWIPQPSDWPSGWSAVCMYSRATAHMRTCAMRIRVAWRSPAPVCPHTLCVYPHSADECIATSRVSHLTDDISDVSRVEIPPTMISWISGSSDHSSVYSQHLCIPGYRVRVCCTTPWACTCMLHTASGCCCCTQDVVRYRIPHPILWMSHSRGPGILDPSGSHRSTIHYSSSHDPRIPGSMDLCIWPYPTSTTSRNAALRVCRTTPWACTCMLLRCIPGVAVVYTSP